MDLPKTKGTVDSFDKKLQKLLKKNLKDDSNTGKLSKSIKVSDKTTKKGVNIILSMEDYGIFVDEGRKPGSGIPVNDLKKWIKQKGLTLKGSKNQSEEQKLNSLSFLINRKIKKEGVAPTNFIKEVLDKYTNGFVEDIAESLLDDGIDDLLENIE